MLQQFVWIPGDDGTGGWTASAADFTTLECYPLPPAQNHLVCLWPDPQTRRAPVRCQVAGAPAACMPHCMRITYRGPQSQVPAARAPSLARCTRCTAYATNPSAPWLWRHRSAPAAAVSPPAAAVAAQHRPSGRQHVVAQSTGQAGGSAAAALPCTMPAGGAAVSPALWAPSQGTGPGASGFLWGS